MSQLTSSSFTLRSRFGALALTIRRWPLGMHLLLAVNLPLALLLLVLMVFEYRDEMDQAILEKETGLADEAVAVHQAVAHLAHEHSVASTKDFIERVCAKMQDTRSPGHAILVVRGDQMSDIALMSDDLSRVAWLISHSQRTLRIVHHNITASLAVKAVFVILTMFGDANLWSAIAADMGVTLLVVFNPLRLLHSQANG